MSLSVSHIFSDGASARWGVVGKDQEEETVWRSRGQSAITEPGLSCQLHARGWSRTQRPQTRGGWWFDNLINPDNIYMFKKREKTILVTGDLLSRMCVTLLFFIYLCFLCGVIIFSALLLHDVIWVKKFLKKRERATITDCAKHGHHGHHDVTHLFSDCILKLLCKFNVFKWQTGV